MLGSNEGISLITVKRQDLLEKIKVNALAHRDIFLKAQERYRALAIEEMDKALEEAKAGKRIKRALMLIEPQDHTHDYNLVIRMLEMSIDDKVEITQQEFAMYVLDDWGWKHQWKASTEAYTVAGAMPGLS